MDFILSANNNQGGTSLETAGALANENNNIETAGSIALFTSDKEDSGFDAFGGKDLFGNPDFSSLDAGFFANAESCLASANNQSETAGSLACADSSSFSGDCGAASASAGSDCGGGSCGGGSFSSVC